MKKNRSLRKHIFTYLTIYSFVIAGMFIAASTLLYQMVHATELGVDFYNCIPGFSIGLLSLLIAAVLYYMKLRTTKLSSRHVKKS